MSNTKFGCTQKPDLKLVFDVTFSTNARHFKIVLYFDQSFVNFFHRQTFKLQMQSPSGNSLAAMNTGNVTQAMLIGNPNKVMIRRMADLFYKA